MKALDNNTARLLLSLARGHLDRPCNAGIPEHLQFELVSILQTPDGDIDESIKAEAMALLKETRGL